MSTIDHASLLTVPVLADELDEPAWKIRVGIDRLGLGFRLRGYRVVERKDVAKLRTEIGKIKKRTAKGGNPGGSSCVRSPEVDLRGGGDERHLDEEGTVHGHSVTSIG